MSIFRRKSGGDSPSEQDASASPADQTEPLGEDGTGEPLLPKVAGFSWRILVVLAMGWVALWLLAKFRLVLLPVVVALFLTALLGPLAQWLKERRWPPLLATWTVLLVAFGSIVGMVFLLAPSVGNELGEVGKAVEEGFQTVLDYLGRSPLNISEQDVDRYIDQVVEALRQNRDRITSGLLSGAAKAVELIAQFFLTIVLTFFFIKDGPQLFGWFERQFPKRNRRHVRSVGERVWTVMRAYLLGTGITGLVDAILIGIVLVVVGVPLVIPLVILTFFGAFFPLVGAIIAGTIASLVALVTTGVADALVVAGATLVIQQVEGDVLQPVVMGRTVNLHPVVILLALTSGAVLAGVVGAFLAVPTVAVAATIGNYVKQVQAGTA